VNRLSFLGTDPVVPVVTLEGPEEAAPLAAALVAGGLTSIEVTLRTSAALDGIARIVAEVPSITVGAGTVRSAEQVERAVAAGASFLVSPASTPRLLDAMAASGLPFLPGVASPSEVAHLLEREIGDMKLFPAEALGGPALLRALSGPFPEARFCPTGGIGPGNAAEYLALENVAAVGGSWVADRVPAAPDWAAISAVAGATSALRSR
jgi:2-dehydro-3-deoxyphosphogluconate aldolase/(4S)-4-hydroxy-2-oxoglutarate aldolase